MVREQRAIFPDGNTCYEMAFDVMQNADTVVMAALYAPANSIASQPLENLTSAVVCRELDVDALNWVDLCVYAPRVTNKHVNQARLQSMVKEDPIHREYWFEKLSNTIVDGSVVLVCGVTCNIAWNGLGNAGFLSTGSPVTLYEEADIKVLRYELPTTGVTFVAVTGAIHPSAHLMAHGHQPVTLRFKRAMRITRALLAMSVIQRKEESESFLSEYMESFKTAEVKRAESYFQKACDALSVRTCEQKKILLRLPWNNHAVSSNITSMIALMKKATVLRLLLISGSFREAMASTMFFNRMQLLKTFCKITTSKQWCTFMCDSVASALSGSDEKLVNDFFSRLERLKTLCKITTSKQWCTVMSDSVASALSESDFDHAECVMNRIERLVKSYLPSLSITLLSRDSIASRIAVKSTTSHLLVALESSAAHCTNHKVPLKLVSATISNNAAMADAWPRITEALETKTEAISIIEFFEIFKGSYGHRTAMAREYEF